MKEVPKSVVIAVYRALTDVWLGRLSKFEVVANRNGVAIITANRQHYSSAGKLSTDVERKSV